MKTSLNMLDDSILKLVSAGSKGVFASTDEKYSYAIFGRDSIEVAEDLLDTNKQLAHDVIITLASLQGVKLNPRNEEEPGKIHHEYRSHQFAGQPISEPAELILRNLQRVWGSDGENDVIYYGSYDATPLYIRLIGRYIQKYGHEILDEEYPARDGKKHDIKYSLKTAQQWLVGKIELSRLGLLEYKPLNPVGIENQVWKDSRTSYIHLDGTLADQTQGVASIELQGYAYDALKICANFSQGDELLKMAEHIQKTVVGKFWMEDTDFFAEGLDYDPRGMSRQIKTLCSNAGVLLESGLLRDLPELTYKKYLKGVSEMLMSPEFLTPVGIRCRALKYKDLPGFVDYHGSYTVWPKETYDIAKGLRNFGLNELAEDLENRILSSVEASGDFFEFFYVDETGRIYSNRSEVEKFLESKRSEDSPLPQRGQAWVISAVLAIKNKRQQ